MSVLPAAPPGPAPGHPRYARPPKRPVETEAPRCPFRQCDPRDAVPVGSGWDFEYDTTDQEFTYGRCPRCGIHLNTTVPVEAEMHRIYPDNYYSFSDSHDSNALVTAIRGFLERRKVKMYRQLVSAEKANVADIGCGDGRLLDILRAHCPAGWSYAGLEIGAGAAETARAKGYDMIAADLDTADITAWHGRFDLVLIHQVLEHTRDPRAALEKLRAIVRPGGILSIETPDTDAWDMRLFRARYWGGWHIPRHFYLFDKQSLPRLAQETGWEVISRRSILSPVFWVHSMHNFCVERPSLRRFAWLFSGSNPIALAPATLVELLQTLAFKKSSNLQIILRRPGDDSL